VADEDVKKNAVVKSVGAFGKDFDSDFRRRRMAVYVCSFQGRSCRIERSVLSEKVRLPTPSAARSSDAPAPP